ncbi:sensor domain-containing protein [Stutzerimonas tarimensis]|uniref:EAL domain-containing protein n=1 Tax=Stutzerimonas tarimensis TaxID=1507735 RepID=A0ABV7T362_9GAMM
MNLPLYLHRLLSDSQPHGLSPGQDFAQHGHRFSNGYLRSGPTALQVIFQTNPDPVMLSEHSTGRLLDVNPGFVRHFGWSELEAVGQTSLELGMMSRGTRQQILDTLESEGCLDEVEVELVSRSGERMQHLLYGGAFVLDGQHCLLITTRDITEQRSQAEALRESQERLKLALDSVELGTWEWHIPSGMIYGSARAARLQGLARGAFQGSTREFFVHVPATDMRSMYGIYHAVASGRRRNFQAQYRCRMPDGRFRYLESTARLYRDAHGKPHRMAGTIVDITERQQAETALRASEAKFARAFHGSPDAIVIVERDSGRFIEVNEAFTRLTGHRGEHAIGRTAEELGLWPDKAQRDRLLRLVEHEGRVVHRDSVFIDRNGSTLHLDVSVEPMSLNETACLLITARDISELKQAQARIQHLAWHDPLTDLPNRALLTDRLTQQIALHKRHDMRGAVLFIDLDHFKHINDSLGHPVGDVVLKMITARLEASVRHEDTVSRLGGDEFVVLLTGLSGRRSEVTRQVRKVAEKLRAVLAEPMRYEGQWLKVTPSMGIALLPDHGETPADLLKRADIALYRAKDAGRNAIQLFRTTMQHAASARLQMENDLRQALLRHEFRLHLQPQVDARDNRIIGAEALLRWDHPKLGPQSPGLFIQLLEESGLIVEVGDWILREACRIGAYLLNERSVDAGAFSLSINISPRQFRQSDFVEQVMRAIGASGVPQRMIKLEITEGIVIQNLEDTIGKMNRLKKAGISFAMDDFGTGYSSLTYLKRLPVDLLKIDQSFVRDAMAGDGDAEIIRAIVSMAASLGLEVIAEGVEQQAQLDILQQRDCHLYQGYLFSRPLPLEMFCELLDSSLARAAGPTHPA